MTLYFDPLPHLGEETAWFGGRWADLKWLNVPGPIYGGETDNCYTGRLNAPAHVLYDTDGFEYVFRQPKSAAETRDLVEAASEDPWQGYAHDGDAHWTPDAVRAWWHDRDRITEYLAVHRTEWAAVDAWHSGQHTAAGVRAYEDYLAGDLAHDLRVYLFWLQEGRSPTPADTLPTL